MRFNPQDANDSPGGQLPPGDYPFMVQSAEERQSKAGNATIHLTLAVQINGKRYQVHDHLVSAPNTTWMIKSFCKAVGLDFDAGEITPDLCAGRQGRARFVKGDRGYLEVKEYLSDMASDPQPAPYQQSASISDDEIPF